MLSAESLVSDMTTLSDESDEEICTEDGMVHDMHLSSVNKWNNNSFIKPFKVLSQLSGYPNLLMLYNIFACLAISSTSAERTLSKLKIIKKTASGLPWLMIIYLH